MAKILRATQKQFGSTALNGRIAEFGSLANGSPNAYSGGTITPAIIQTLANYLQGWDGAVIGNNSPALQDMNALQYLFSYQLGYLLQEGIAEWDSATTYFIGSIVSSGGVSYYSLQDNNIGNALTNGAYWAQPIQNGLVTEDVMPMSAVVLTGNTMTYPNVVIPNNTNLTVETGAAFIGFDNFSLQGNAVLSLQGTATFRLI